MEWHREHYLCSTTQVRYAYKRAISERYDTWWKSRWGKFSEPDLLARQLDALVHTGDPATPPSVDDIALACEVVWMHRGWEYFQARLAFTMAAFNVLVQWYGLPPNASGFVPLSIA